jgi:hypothetical protein
VGAFVICWAAQRAEVDAVAGKPRAKAMINARRSMAKGLSQSFRAI